MFKKIKQFLEDVQAEFKKVHWPNRDSTLKSTSVVLLVSLIIAAFLGVSDLGLARIMKLLIST